MFFDWRYLVYMLPALLLSLWAGARVKSTFARYQNQQNTRGLSGSEAARRILNANGLTNVRIERVGGELSDHYDPRSNIIRLSAAVHDSRSTAALGVAAHEVGHAIQHAQSYVPLKLRNAIIPMTNLGAKLAMPLFLFGFLLSAVDQRLIAVAYVGIFAFSLALVFQLLTLPTEYNASRRAMVCLERECFLSDEELHGARKVLSAAALTYVAAMAVSLMQLLRLLAIVNRHRD